MPTTLNTTDRYSTDTETIATLATIASVSDQAFCVTRTYGVFQIPACLPGEVCATLAVKPRGDAIDLGDSHRITLQIPAREIAEDLIQDLTQHGIFVCAAQTPSSEEIASAQQTRDAWYKRLVTEADEMWARGHSYREISDMHRRAAHRLNLDREWAYVPERSVECPVCGEKVKAGVAICKHCKAVLDAERAAKYFPNGTGEKLAPRSAPASQDSSGAKPVSAAANSSHNPAASRRFS